MLENVVNGITDLRDVKNQAAKFRAQMGTNLTYDQYYTPVLSATQVYDAHHITNATYRGTRRSMYNSTMYHECRENDICERYNIQSSIFQLSSENNQEH